MRCAQDFLVFASKARSGLDPAAALVCITKDAVLGSYADVVCGFVHGWAPRDRSSARREALKAQPLRCAQVFFGVRFQSSLRTDPAPLTYFLLRIGPMLAGNVGIGGAFALAREGA